MGCGRRAIRALRPAARPGMRPSLGGGVRAQAPLWLEAERTLPGGVWLALRIPARRLHRRASPATRRWRFVFTASRQPSSSSVLAAFDGGGPLVRAFPIAGGVPEKLGCALAATEARAQRETGGRGYANAAARARPRRHSPPPNRCCGQRSQAGDHRCECGGARQRSAGPCSLGFHGPARCVLLSCFRLPRDFLTLERRIAIRGNSFPFP